MNALLAARVRRQAPLFAAVGLLAGFSLLHAVEFQPLAARYQRALGQAGAMGAILDPHGVSTPALPPRVFSLLMDNSLPPTEADRRGVSGQLGAELVQALSGLAARHQLEVVVAEPGLLTQQPNNVEARAHLRLRGSYAGFTRFMDELARGGRLWMVERFSIVPRGDGHCDIEIYVAGCVLKRAGGPS